MMDHDKDMPPTDRLDRLLRQWGGENAVNAEEANLGQAPRLDASVLEPEVNRGLSWVLARLGPVLAAAGLMFAVAGAIFYMSARSHHGHDRTTETQANSVIAPATSPDDQLAALRRENQSLIVQLENIIADNRNQAVEFGERERWLNALHKEDLAKHERRLAAAQADAVERLDELNKAEAALAAAKLLLATSADELAAARTRAEQIGKALDAARADLPRQRRQALEQFAAVYLGGSDSLAARQQAVRSRRLIERYAAIRDKIKGEPNQQLAETLEVWLTRLDQVDVRNATAADQFVAQLGREKLAEKIELALAGESQTGDVRAWLLECELVLLDIG